MQTLHQFVTTASPNGLLFECEAGCGRRLVVDRAGALTVLDKGDPWALHRGGLGEVELEVAQVHQG